MNILLVHNYYSNRGGEESVVEMQQKLFSERGDNVYTYFRHYSEMEGWKNRKVKSFFCSLYNFKAARDVRKLVRKNKIEVAFIHNIYPIISPSVLSVLKSEGVKVVWFAHNFRLLCPTGLFYTQNEVCEQCAKKCCKELNCVKRQCEGSRLGSIAYALRGFNARAFGYTKKYVDLYIALTRFSAVKLAANGFDDSKIAVIGNCVTFPENCDNKKRDGSVLFVGRLSKEKGVDRLLEVAAAMPSVSFIAAGDGGDIDKNSVPSNLTLLGKVNKEQLVELYKKCSIVFIPSQCYEGFGLVAVEAGFSKAAVVASGLGSLATLIEHDKTGLLFDSEDSADAVEKIEYLLSHERKRKKLAHNLFDDVTEKFNADNYYNSIMERVREEDNSRF